MPSGDKKSGMSWVYLEGNIKGEVSALLLDEHETVAIMT